MTQPLTPPEEMPPDLIGADDLRTRLDMTLRMAMRAQAMTNEVVLQLQKLSAQLPAETPALDLGEGSVLSPMWRTDEALEVLKERTGQAWTAPKLLNVAIAKGWRSSGTGHKPLASLFCTRVVNRYKPEGTVVYTYRALDYIIAHKEECWRLAGSKSVAHI